MVSLLTESISYQFILFITFYITLEHFWLFLYICVDVEYCGTVAMKVDCLNAILLTFPVLLLIVQ